MHGKFVAWFCGLAILNWVAACSNTSCPLYMPTTATLSISGQQLLVEIAATPSQRTCGLSFREHLPANHGMLFVYPDVGIREFWMKDTRIPLDLAFLAEGGHIVEIYQMSPSEPEYRYRSGQPVAFALEVAGGWFEAHDVHIGDAITIQIPESVEIR
jgi:uncharacterized membrane protein (UPF0127 family)